MRKSHPILRVELNSYILDIGGTAIQSTSLNASQVWHDLQFSVQRAAASRAEEVLVDLSRVSNGIVSLESANDWGVSLSDFESCPWYDNVRRIGSARPLLTVGAVAECCYSRFT